ncbi:MAG: hypothetical protein MUC64_04590 [Rubritepida sp.]|jgi:hypothetical protein|nr:hypothetical protein [Rubritepida sp.]
MEGEAGPRRGGAVARRRRVIALIRTHLPRSERVFELGEALESAGFEVRVAADETHGTVDAGRFEKRPHSLAMFKAMGLPMPGPEHRLMRYRGDYALIGSTPDRRPQDFYLMVEYDVGLRNPASDYWRRLRAVLNRPRLEMIGAYLRRYRRTRFRHGFAEPWKCFFPIVGVSGRAIDVIEAGRRRLGAGPEPDRRGVHCEVFVPSVLQEQGFRLHDLNRLLPGSIDHSTFSVRDIYPATAPDVAFGDGELAHRVTGFEEFLAKAPIFAIRNNTAPKLRKRLGELAGRGADAEALARCEAELARLEAERASQKPAAA